MTKKRVDQPILQCLICDNYFRSKNNLHKYCSLECRRQAEESYKNRCEYNKRCVYCGTEYTTYKSVQKYCTNECQSKAWVEKQREYNANTQHPYLKMRFEVFKRDNFHCRYCGRGVDDGIKLVTDHILSKKQGGQDKLSNFITACEECNSGKSDILLLANKGGQIPSFIAI